MKINSDFISDVKSKLDIVDVIGAYINLQKAGINYKGICPFHNDSHPSMMVNKARQTYHCFVCGEHGDVLDFLQKYNHLKRRLCQRSACLLMMVLVTAVLPLNWDCLLIVRRMEKTGAIRFMSI